MGWTSASISDRLLPAGAIMSDVNALWTALWRQTHVPAATIELCRLLLARRYQLDDELQLRTPGVDLASTKIAAVHDDSWTTNPAITDHERTALEFTEYFQVDSQSIPDEAANGVIAHYGESGLVALIQALCFIDGRIRLARVFSNL